MLYCFTNEVVQLTQRLSSKLAEYIPINLYNSSLLSDSQDDLTW